MSYSEYNSNYIVEGTKATTTKTGATSNYITLGVGGFTAHTGVWTLSGYLKVNGKIPTSCPLFQENRASTFGMTMSLFMYDPLTGYFRITQEYRGNSNWVIHSPSTLIANDVLEFDKLVFNKGHIPLAYE